MFNQRVSRIMSKGKKRRKLDKNGHCVTICVTKLSPKNLLESFSQETPQVEVGDAV